MNDADCLFCKIINGEIPSIKIFENEEVYAFLDIRPVNPGHTLIVPKKHFQNLYELPDATLIELAKALRDLSSSIKKALEADGINIEMNNDRAAGQIIFHAHFHIIPRFMEDGLRHWPGHDKEIGEQKNIAQKIISELSKE